MKFNFDKKYLYYGLTALIVSLSAVLFNFLLNKYSVIVDFIGEIWRITSPIIYGCIIAFLFDPIINWLEKRFFPFFDKKLLNQKDLPLYKKRLVRIISLVLTYFIALVVVAAFLLTVIPQITMSIQDIIDSSNTYRLNFLKWATNLSKRYPDLYKFVIELYSEYSMSLEDFLSTKILPWLQSIIGSMYTSIFGVFTTVKNLVIGFVVSIYILLYKEKFKGQFKKMGYGLFKIKTGNVLIANSRFVKEKFSSFIVGKIIDSFVIGVICYIGCKIFKFDYEILLSLIIGVTNIIPFFGPIIGAIPCAILLLLISPIKCLYFILFVIVLQLLDGNVIGPKILGSSTGLDSFWVIFAILFFGGIWGVPGMIIGVPLFAIVYAALKTIFETSLKKKGLSPNTNDYVYTDHIDEETKEFHANVVTDDIIKHSNNKKRNLFTKRLHIKKTDNVEEEIEELIIEEKIVEDSKNKKNE